MPETTRTVTAGPRECCAQRSREVGIAIDGRPLSPDVAIEILAPVAGRAEARDAVAEANAGLHQSEQRARTLA